MEGGPSKFVGLFVWAKDSERFALPINNLQHAEHSFSDNQVTDDDTDTDADAETPSKSFVSISLVTGTGTFSFSTFDLGPPGFDPKTTKFDSYVNRLLVKDEAGAGYKNSSPQHKMQDLPELVLAIGGLYFR